MNFWARIRELETTFGPGMTNVVTVGNEWIIVWRWKAHDFWLCHDDTEVITRWQDRSSVIKTMKELQCSKSH